MDLLEQHLFILEGGHNLFLGPLALKNLGLQRCVGIGQLFGPLLYPIFQLFVQLA